MVLVTACADAGDDHDTDAAAGSSTSTAGPGVTTSTGADDGPGSEGGSSSDDGASGDATTTPGTTMPGTTEPGTTDPSTSMTGASDTGLDPQCQSEDECFGCVLEICCELMTTCWDDEVCSCLANCGSSSECRIMCGESELYGPADACVSAASQTSCPCF